jgi:hypothetical protein
MSKMGLFMANKWKERVNLAIPTRFSLTKHCAFASFLFAEN